MSDYGIEKKAPTTNQSARVTECTTCQGDRFVTVRLRSPHNKEVAPCPDCNQIDVSYTRFDGSRFRGMDPAAVREAIKQ